MEERLRNTATKISFPLIDNTTGKFYTSDTLTNLNVQGVIFSESGTPTLHNISGTPARVGPFWFLDLTQAEMNVSDDYLNIMIVADEISSQAVGVKLVDELTETKFAGLETDIAACLQFSEYTAPDNTSIAAIKAKTDNLPADPASETTVNSRLASVDFTTGLSSIMSAFNDLTTLVNAIDSTVIANLIASTEFKELMTLSVGNFSIAGNVVTFSRSGVSVSFNMTEISRTRI